MDKPLFPIGIAYIATAIKREGYQFDLIDIERYRYTNLELSELLLKRKYDVIAFGTLVSGYKYAKAVAQIARDTNPKAILIAGNSVASSIPEYLLENTAVDIAVVGEGELTMINILKAIEQGKSIEEVKGIVIKKDNVFINTGFDKPIDIEYLGYPNWELFDINYYIEKGHNNVLKPYPIPLDQIKAFVVNTARGCPFRCTFCYHVFQYTKYRFRSPKSIIEEIRILNEKYGINYINFFDELTFFTKKQVIGFVDAVLKSGLKFYWIADIRSDLFNEKDFDLLRRVREAGCLCFGYSLESGNSEILRSMGKKLTVENFKRQKSVLDKVGISTVTSIVIGYPDETLGTLKETFDVCYDLDIYPSTGYLLPQPGTPMFDIAKDKGYVNDMEDYLYKMGDRQDLRYNLTDMPDDILIGEVNFHLKRIAVKLKLNIEGGDLMKTKTHIKSTC